VKLTKGVLYDGIFHHREGRAEKEEELKGSSEIPEIRVVEDTLARNKQAIIFYATRRGAEFGAAKIAKHVHASLPPEERQRLKELGAVVTGVLDKPTEQCAKLGSLIANGVAFHHAGLLSQQRKYIEDAFRAGTVRVVCSTTTLGYGINMPAHTVLVRDLTRFDGNYSTRISVNEVLQLFGRAGRPKYDTEGRAIIPANGKYRIAELKGRYIDAEPEPVSSLLGVAPVLRSHILAFIAGRFLNSAESIGGFISKSLYGKQYGDSGKIETRVGEMMADLEGWEFVERHGKLYTATKLGERISELYIDPLSARLILDGLKTAKETFDVLLLISNTLEMRPHAKITAQAANRYAAYISANGVTVFSSDRLVNYAGYDPISVFSTAMMLEDWIKEVREADIVKRFSSSPGALYAKLLNADWMIYSATELARLTRTPRAELVKARVRLRYGIKEELLDLVRLEQIGRVRARMLYDNGIETAAEITKNKDRVVELLGKEVAEKVFGQLE